jgi:hypothetical protein
MKTFILTIDYELFLGSRTGTVEKCMLEPTYRLAKMLDMNNSKMTVFWDILHYYRLKELENDFTNLKNDRKLIDEQISFLISKGHDIQLHLHPQWLDAKYNDGEWKFKYDHYNIHTLSEEENPERIETILGCITAAKKLMEKEIRKYIPDYEVTTYRAGGFRIEPFVKLKKAFEYNNIYIDSSVLPGMTNNNRINFYDFRNYPSHNYYHFENSPSELSEEGRFIEFPVTTISIPVYKNIIFTLTRFLKYKNLESGRMGSGSGEISNDSKKSIIKKIKRFLTKSKLTLLTTDGNFAERFNYIFRKVKSGSTMILHPKLLNLHTFNILEDKLSNKEVKFVSINNFLNEIE